MKRDEYNRCNDCRVLFPLVQLHHIGLRWWLCRTCFSLWHRDDIEVALESDDNRCWAHGVMSCEDCYPERYYHADGKLWRATDEPHGPAFWKEDGGTH